MRIGKHAGLAALLLAAASPGAAQQLRGTVRDSVSGAAIAGAVLVARDAAGNVVARTIADSDGAYTLSAPRAADLRAMRIGFTPRTAALAPGDGPGVRTVDIELAAIPTFLDQVRVVADRAACGQRPDAAAAANLYEQARAGLTAIVVARETDPAAMDRLLFDRTLDANGVRAVSQIVRSEKAARATASFNAALSVREFVRRGFASDTGAERTYFGPDAEVLLDDAFASAYCFRIAEPDTAHPALIGLRFAPPIVEAGRVDIDGTLWIDTVAREIRATEFRYLGLDDISTGFGSGGSVSYREVARGVALIDSWTLRLVGGMAPGPDPRAVAPRPYEIHEIGGHLAAVTWPDGRSWRARLASARITAVSAAGTPAPPGTVLGLANTDYRAETDSAGIATFRDLLPGPYSVMIVDPQLADLGLTIPTGLTFVAADGPAIAASVPAPSASEYVASLCGARNEPARESAWLVGRVGTTDGHPGAAARWRLSRSVEGRWKEVAAGNTTAATGLFVHCRNLAVGETIRVEAWRRGETPTAVIGRLSGNVTALRVLLPSAAPARSNDTAPLRGVVRDSVGDSTVVGALIEVAGLRQTAISDTDGRFHIAAAPRGELTVEIRTPALEALGAVGRVTVRHDGRTPVQVHVPSIAQVVDAICAPTPDGGPGLLVGSISAPDRMRLPAGVGLVASWADTALAPFASDDSVRRTRWSRTPVNADGTFRLCGVPVGVSISIRTQVDSGNDLAAWPPIVTIEPAGRYARLDIAMERGLALGATFAGTVVSDAADEPLDGAEVALPDLGMAAVAGATGQFLINAIPPGTHRVTVRHAGFAPLTALVDFAQNQVVDHRIVMKPARPAPPGPSGPPACTAALCAPPR